MYNGIRLFDNCCDQSVTTDVNDQQHTIKGLRYHQKSQVKRLKTVVLLASYSTKYPFCHTQQYRWICAINYMLQFFNKTIFFITPLPLTPSPSPEICSPFYQTVLVINTFSATDLITQRFLLSPTGQPLGNGWPYQVSRFSLFACHYFLISYFFSLFFRSLFSFVLCSIQCFMVSLSGVDQMTVRDSSLR